MFPSPPLPWFELARFGRSRLTRAAILAIMLVPLFYGALYVWANLNPTGNLDHVRAAVVNQDEPVTVTGHDGKEQTVAVGRLLAGKLVRSDDSKNYDWVLTDNADAQKGLVDGKYRTILTIPKNLSHAATSTGGTDPTRAIQGNLHLQSNDAINYINGTIAQTILKTAKASLNAQVTETYLDNIYLSFSDIKMSLDEAADGAGKLADGANTLADGNHQLADGAAKLQSGAGQLAGGLGTLAGGTRTLPRDTQRLADGAKQVAGGTARVNALVQSVTGQISRATTTLNANAGTFKSQLQALKDQCVPADTPQLCTQIDRALTNFDQLKALANVPATQAKKYAGQTQQLSDGAAQVAGGNAKLAANVPKLVSGIKQAAAGADQLKIGTTQLSDGADEAAAGADQLSSGIVKLETGLRSGSDKVPDYNADERSHLAKTATTPVTDASGRLHGVANYGEALAPYFIALALWVGAMAIYLLLRPLSQRAIASTASSARIALAGFAPGVLVSAVQVVLLLGVLRFLVGIDAANTLELLGLALITGITFTAFNQMFIAVLRGAGRFVAIVFVCLQLTAAGGTYPIETAPRFFGFLHNLLPMSYAVDGFRKAIAGGGVGVGTDIFALVVFTLIALAITVVAAQRSRMITMKRLHPTLAI